MVLCKLSFGVDGIRPVVTHTLTIKDDLSWILYVYEHKVEPSTCKALKSFQSVLDTDSLPKLLNALDNLTVCAGHPDDHFIKMITAKKGKILSKQGTVTAVLDKTPVHLNGKPYLQTIRTSLCEILCNGTKCSSCTSYRTSLRAIYHKWT